MGWKSNIGLLLVVSGLGSYLWFVEEKPPEQKKENVIGAKPLLPKGPWIAKKIKFQYDDTREPVVLTLDAQNQEFRIEEPVADIASFAVLKSIFDVYSTANVITGYSAEELKKDPTLVKKTGLDEPKGYIEFHYVTQPTVRVEFGNPGVRKNVMWVRVGDAIYRADPTLRKLLRKNPDEFREHLLFTDLNVGDFVKIRLDLKVRGKVQTHIVHRKSPLNIRITQPIDARVNSSALGGYMTSIGSLFVERFVSGGTNTPTAEDPPDYSITVQGTRGSETLDVRLLDDGMLFGHLRRRDINFSVKRLGMERVPQWLPALRAKQLAPTPEKDIARFELRSGKNGAGKKGGRALFVRTAEGFRIEKPFLVKKTNPTPLSELLHSLTRLEAKSFVDEPGVDAGVADGDDYFTVEYATQFQLNRPVTIRFGKPAGEGLVYAKRVDDKVPVTVSAELVAAIRREWTDFISAYVPPPTDKAFRVEATSPSGVTRTYTYQDFEWLEEGKKVEDGEVRDFVDALKTLRAKGVVLASDLDPDAKVVKVLLRRNIHKVAGEIYQLTLRAGDGKDVLLRVRGQENLAYRIRQAPFRALLDRWMK